MSEFPTVGVIGKQGDPRVIPTVAALCRRLRELRRDVLLEEGMAGAFESADVRIVARSELPRSCSLVVVVGGDGTLLSAARLLAPAGVPILGVNQGRLGFMVDVRPADMDETLGAVFAGEYLREDRILLQARILREVETVGPFLAINDVVIRNQTAIRMLEFETWLGQAFISQHRADGFIVSSPTGSTAYALSGGGPVLHPSLDAIALVPICPHTLSDRPIVVSGKEAVRIVLRGAPGTRAMFTCDGQNQEHVSPGDTVEVSQADCCLSLIHPRNYDYFGILRSKLHWGRGPAQNQQQT